MPIRKQYRGVKLDSTLTNNFKPVKGTSGLCSRDQIRLPATPYYRLQTDHVDNIWRPFSDTKWLIDQILDGGIYSISYKWAGDIINKN
jgi:hypothetical protein